MARLIDADALRDALPVRWESALRCIREAPTVDAVPVIRCCECRYWDGEGRCEAPVNGLVREYTKGTDFCSYGEKEDGSDG